VYEHDEDLTPLLKSILHLTEEAAGTEIVYLKNPLKEPHYLTEMVDTQPDQIPHTAHSYPACYIGMKISVWRENRKNSTH